MNRSSEGAQRRARRPWLLNRGKPDRIGRVQRQILRAFIASNGQPLLISDLLPRCYPRAKRFEKWHRNGVHAALRRFAVSLGRLPNVQGRPALWAPKSACLLPTRCQATG
jgi:hypothetical protein